MITMKRIIKKTKLIRTILNIPQHTAAKEMGLCQPVLSGIERGTYNKYATKKIVFQLAKWNSRKQTKAQRVFNKTMS